MSDIVLHTAVKVQTAQASAIEYTKRAIQRMRDEEGQGALEYVGLIVVVAIIIGAVLAIIPNLAGKISQEINHIVTSILGGNDPKVHK